MVGCCSSLILALILSGSLTEAWQVARPTGERREALREPRQQRLRWEQLDPRGGEFERERQPVEASTDRRDGQSVRVGHVKVGFHRSNDFAQAPTPPT